MIKTNKKIAKQLYWILSCTWGILMTLAGALVACWLMCKGFVPEKNQYGWVFKVGSGWGGLSLGPIALVSYNSSQHTLNHEFGHSIQNCAYGPFMVLITLASAARYHYRNWISKHKPTVTLPPYDAIWFEGEATEIGNFYKGE